MYMTLIMGNQQIFYGLFLVYSQLFTQGNLELDILHCHLSIVKDNTWRPRCFLYILCVVGMLTPYIFSFISLIVWAFTSLKLLCEKFTCFSINYQAYHRMLAKSFTCHLIFVMTCSYIHSNEILTSLLTSSTCCIHFWQYFISNLFFNFSWATIK